MKKLALIALMSMLATGVSAHSRVDKTTPENGATIAQAPSEISFDFAADIRLTRVNMTHGDQSAVRLDLGEQTKFGRAFILPIQDMGKGLYHIEWRGLGIDGHAMQGEFTFTVD